MPKRQSVDVAVQPSVPLPLATPQEVADFLRKPVKTLTEWRYRGIGPSYITVGRDVRYRWSDVDEWLTGRQIDPSAPAA